MKKITAQELEWFETRVKEAFKAGEINCPIHLAGGNEEILIRIFEEVKPRRLRVQHAQKPFPLPAQRWRPRKTV
jgi:hypothetical protein